MKEVSSAGVEALNKNVKASRWNELKQLEQNGGLAEELEIAAVRTALEEPATAAPAGDSANNAAKTHNVRKRAEVDAVSSGLARLILEAQAQLQAVPGIPLRRWELGEAYAAEMDAPIRESKGESW